MIRRETSRGFGRLYGGSRAPAGRPPGIAFLRPNSPRPRCTTRWKAVPGRRLSGARERPGARSRLGRSARLLPRKACRRGCPSDNRGRGKQFGLRLWGEGRFARCGGDRGLLGRGPSRALGRSPAGPGKRALPRSYDRHRRRRNPPSGDARDHPRPIDALGLMSILRAARPPHRPPSFRLPVLRGYTMTNSSVIVVHEQEILPGARRGGAARC